MQHVFILLICACLWASGLILIIICEPIPNFSSDLNLNLYIQIIISLSPNPKPQIPQFAQTIADLTPPPYCPLCVNYKEGDFCQGCGVKTYSAELGDMGRFGRLVQSYGFDYITEILEDFHSSQGAILWIENLYEKQSLRDKIKSLEKEVQEKNLEIEALIGEVS